ncbi:hypothetical protein [Streptomyces albireticuli]|uniref:hypothetical protein n=1 Tax=Streptomyces albireticuli TaxID=1940 RepID=UPI00368B4F12
MPIELRPIQFTVDQHVMATPYVETRGFSLDGTVRTGGKKKNPVMSVALQSFSLEVLVNGNPTQAPMALDQVELEIVRAQDPNDDAAVRLTLRRRINQPEASANPAWQFRGTVTALVIADLATT